MAINERGGKEPEVLLPLQRQTEVTRRPFSLSSHPWLLDGILIHSPGYPWTIIIWSFSPLFLFDVYECLACMHVYAPCVYSVPSVVRRVCCTPENGVTDGCKLPCRCLNLNLPPEKSNKCSYLLNYLQQHHHPFVWDRFFQSSPDQADLELTIILLH